MTVHRFDSSVNCKCNPRNFPYPLSEFKDNSTKESACLDMGWKFLAFEGPEELPYAAPGIDLRIRKKFLDYFFKTEIFV